MGLAAIACSRYLKGYDSVRADTNRCHGSQVEVAAVTKAWALAL